MDADLQTLRSAMAKLDAPWRAYQRQSERLASARQRYLDFFEFSPEAYVLTSSWCTVRGMNRTASELLGSPSRLLVGKPLAVLVHLDDRREFRNGVSAFKNGGTWRQDHPVRIGREGRDRTAVTLAVREMGPGLCWSLRLAA